MSDGSDPGLRRALVTGASLVVALVVIASVSGPLGAPRTITLCAATLGQTAHEIQSTFRAMTARESRRTPGEPGMALAGAGACGSARSGRVVAFGGEVLFVRERCDLPPPAAALG